MHMSKHALFMFVDNPISTQIKIYDFRWKDWSHNIPSLIMNVYSQTDLTFVVDNIKDHSGRWEGSMISRGHHDQM